MPAALDARRTAVLAGWKRAAAASPAGSPPRSHWEHFLASEQEVDRIRKTAALTPGGKFKDSFSCDEVALRDLPSEVATTWVPICDMAPVPQVIHDGFEAGDVRQGAIGDCYFLAALAVLASNPASSSLDALIVTTEYNPEGVYGVRFWRDNAWHLVVVDDRFLAYKGMYRRVGDDTLWSGEADPTKGKFYVPYGAHSATQDEFWVMLLEKAFAKFHGSVRDISSGTSLEALRYLVPHSGCGLSLDIASLALPSEQERFWTDLNGWVSRAWPVAVGTPPRGASSSPPEEENDAATTGLVSSHGYTLMGVYSDPSSGLRLLKLRNPWGKGTFRGVDPVRWTPELEKAVGRSAEAAGDNGVFYLSFSDFIAHFASVFMLRCISLANEGGAWHKWTARGLLRGEHALGKSFDELQMARFSQFGLLPTKESEFVIALEVEELFPTRRRNLDHQALVDVAVFKRKAKAGGGGAPSERALRMGAAIGAAAAFFPNGTVGYFSGRVDEAVSSCDTQQQESVLLRPADGPYTLIPYFSGQLYAPARSFTLTVISNGPFSLCAFDEEGRVRQDGSVVEWSRR